MDNEIAAIDEISKMTSQSEKSKITGLGARLRKARESMQLTQKEAAARLYLNPKIVEVIENEAFFEGPPITFMRGYLRSYARLLNFSESDINAAIDELELNASPTTPTAPLLQPSPIYRGDRYIRWITYLIVATLISLVIVWWSSHSKYVIADVPSTGQTPVTTITTPDTVVETSTTVPTENTPVMTPQPAEPTTQSTTIPTPSETLIKTEPVATRVAPAALPKTQAVETKSIPATVTKTDQPAPIVQDQQQAESTTPQVTVAPVQATATPVETTTAQTAAPTTTETAPTAAMTTPADTQNTQVQTANMTAGASDPLAATTTPEATTVKEKPKTRSRKHRRHQYRPIENMELPEPE